MLELYRNIKMRREELGMSQAELARAVGYTDRSSIAKIESGKVDLPQSKIIEIANALRIPAGDLMGLDGVYMDANGEAYSLSELQPIEEEIIEKVRRLSPANQHMLIGLVNAMIESQEVMNNGDRDNK